MIHAVLLFSGGKDSVLALAALRADPAIARITLLATLTADDDCLATHRVPRVLLESQAASLALPIRFATIPRGAPNEQYEAGMNAALADLHGQPGVALAAGDLHLADIRAWRETWAARIGMPMRFPLWGRDPLQLARAFIADGYRGLLVCVDTTRLAAACAGARFDRRLLDALPSGTDPCGENGEFHTFVTGGPGFAFDVPALPGRVYQDGVHACAPLRLGPAERCTQCQAPFTCAATRPGIACWCVRMPPTAPDPLAVGCLCPRCLAARVGAVNQSM